MAVNKRLLQGAAAAGGFVPSEHFGVVLYEGDGTTSHSINGGKFGAGAYFNGSNGYIEPSGSNVLNERTISMWFTLGSYNTYGNYLLDSNDRSLNAHSYGSWSIHLTSGGTHYFTWDKYNNINYGIGDISYTFNTNTWYHLVFVVKANSQAVYVNGVSQTLNNITRAADVNAVNMNVLRLGGEYTTAADYTHIGKIDQVRIFQKELSSSEVSTLYAETASTVTSLDPLSEDTTDTLQVLGDSSCVATYRFENNEDDLSGNYNGTVSGGVQYAVGRYGQAIEFSSGHVNTGHNFNLANNSFSFSFWFANSATGSTNSYVISTDGPQTQNNHLLIGRRDSNGKLNFAFYANDLDSATSVSTDGTWQHWVCTYNASTNARKIYLNGSLDASDTASADYQGTGNVEFGFGIYQAYGKLDQVRIFNKELSASEVTTLYNENSLVASYRFEGNANDDTRNYDGTASNVTYEYGLNFTPDLIWAKARDRAGEWHMLSDSTRGTNSQLFSNATNAQDTKSTVIQSFDTGGFTVGSDALVNFNGSDYVAWCFKANGGTTSSNTDGNITSTVQVNEQAGFSIIQYTSPSSPSSSTDRVGHGLGTTPAMVIVKRTDGPEDWYIWHKELGGGGSGALNKFLRFNTDAQATASNLFNTVNSTVVNLSYTSTGSLQNIAYAFAEVEGFSKFGTYTGNGSEDGPIIETGFEPAMVIIKVTSTSGFNWYIVDNKRDLTNPRKTILYPNLSNAEVTSNWFDFYSNGFKVITTSGGANLNGATIIYMAFAADPDTEAPTVAKSFSTVAYTGTGSARSIEGLGFQPNLVFIKQRSGTQVPIWYDSVRGPGVYIYSSSTAAQGGTSSSSTLTSFDNDGFSLGTSNSENQSGQTYVAWAWKADDNEPTINTEGSLDTVVSANANAGFSIVKVTGGGVNTFGHGLSSAPELIIFKGLNVAQDWYVYHKDLNGGSNPAHYFIKLNSTDAEALNGSSGGSIWNSTAPTSTVFSLGTSLGNGIAYCFHSVAGYSKIGSYSGTSSSGNSVNVGFAPDWVLIKGVTAGSAWILHDTVRSDGTAHLRPNTIGAEDTGANEQINFTSTGFSIRNSATTQINTSGHTYIYAAFKIN